MYEYITKLCRQKTQGIQNNENSRIPSIGQSEARQKNTSGLNLAALRAIE
jgi:hypothetical protein